MRSDLLEQLTRMGPFFALSAHRAERDPRWQPLRTLLQGDSMKRRSAQLAQTLASSACVDAAQVDTRVADSVLQLGLGARLVSPWLGLAALGVRAPVEVHDLRWIPSASSSFQLSVNDAALASDPLPAAEWAGILAHGLLTDVVDSVVGSPQVLWGNVVSAINGAVSASRSTRPDLTLTMRAAAIDLLAALPGSHLPGVAYTGQVATASFRRRSCCLLYRIGPGSSDAMCGDCVLRGRSARGQ